MAPRDRDLHDLLEHRLHRRHRLDRRRRRRRAGTLFAGAVLAATAVVLLAGFGAGTALSVTCDLGALRPIAIGQNSFVYAADGTLLGSIPAACVTAHAPSGRTARRPSAGAVDLRPVPQSTRRDRASQRGAVRDVPERGHHACAVPVRAPLSAAARARPPLQQDQAALLLL